MQLFISPRLFPADGVSEKHHNKIDDLIMPETATSKVDPLADGFEDSLLPQIPGQEYNFSKPRRRRRDRLALRSGW
jgi:hypothetical protein